MGTTPSVNLLPNQNTNLNYFSIQFSRSDRLRLILAPDIIQNITRDVLKSNWVYQEENKQFGFIEFKLFGSPWNYQKSESKLFLCNLLEKYYENGWHLNASTDIQRYGNDTDVLFFQKIKPINTSIICLSLDSTDLIRVFGDEKIYAIIKHSVIKAWNKGLQHEEITDKYCEFKLYGNPWDDSIFDDSDTFHIPFFILDLINNLYKSGWLFFGAINSVKKNKSVNSLYFRREEIPINEAEHTRFFAMSLHSSDEIRFYKLDKDLKSLISSTDHGLANLWTKGIQFKGTIEHVLDFKLKGNPWDSNGEEAVESRRLINNLLNLFDLQGWGLYATCVLTKKLNNTSTFFFRTKQIDNKNKINMCLSLHEDNVIRLVESEDGLVEEVKDAIDKCWPKGIKNESNYFGSKQIRLRDDPFSCHGAKKIYSCAMMTFILNNLDKKGYRLLCSADISRKFHRNRKVEFSTDLHSWFFDK